MMIQHKETEIEEYIRDQIKELKEYDKEEYNQLVKDEELHNQLFNTDYYIIGTYEAKQWLGAFAFEAIEKIQEYENDNFGELTTDLSEPEKVVNMYVYIIGEELLWRNGSKYYE